MALMRDSSRTVRRRGAMTVFAIAAAIAALLIAVPVASAKFRPPPVHHVWVIDLENENFGYTFGPSGHHFSPYLTKTLVADGALLRNYYGIGHDSLDNYIAEISGQSGNYEINEDCGIYTPFVQFGGENFDKFTKYGQLSGEGCVFPKYIHDDRLAAAKHHLTWREYAQDMGNDPHRDGTVMTPHGPACGHPKIGARRPDRQHEPGQRQLRDPPQPVHVLQVDHRTQVLLRLARGDTQAAGKRPAQRRDDAELFDGHTQHVLRRPRLPQVPERRARPAAAGQPVPREVDPGDHGVSRLPTGRADPDHVRRVRPGQQRGRVLRRGRRSRFR